MDVPRRQTGAGIVFLDLGIEARAIDRAGMIPTLRQP